MFYCIRVTIAKIFCKWIWYNVLTIAKFYDITWRRNHSNTRFRSISEISYNPTLTIYLGFFLSDLLSDVSITYCLWDTQFIHTVSVWQVKLIPNAPWKAAFWSWVSFYFTTISMVLRIACLLCSNVRSGHNWFSKNKWENVMGYCSFGFRDTIFTQSILQDEMISV